MSKLVIVESPAKAKTIKKYLGSGYEVVASMGHVRDLQENRLSVDIKNDFKPKYEIIKGKEKLVQELKSAAEKSESVLLATDPDREGEAISWHLAYLLDLDTALQNRITFNEITKTGITNGMEHPRSIDLDLVNAQQARRILDRLGAGLLALLILTVFYFVVKLLSGCSAISCAHGGFRPPKTRLKSVGTQCSSQSGFVPPQIPRLGASKSAQPFNRRLTILFRISSMLSHSFSSCAKSEFSLAGAGEKQLFFMARITPDRLACQSCGS